MPSVTVYSPELDTLLPATAAILKATTWDAHPGIARIVLVGSRGLSGGYRHDSDIDLSLIVDPGMLPASEPEREQFLRAIIETSLESWRSPVELDTAAVFGSVDALRMVSLRDYDEALARRLASGLGLYKLQKGFSGYVPSRILDWRKVYPMLTIWER